MLLEHIFELEHSINGPKSAAYASWFRLSRTPDLEVEREVSEYLLFQCGEMYVMEDIIQILELDGKKQVETEYAGLGGKLPTWRSVNEMN